MSDRFINDDGAFLIDPMPSQPQLALCHGFFVQHSKRGKGRAHGLKALQNQILHELQYDFAVCTVDGSNEAQKKVLTRAGWRWLASFINRKTGSHTELWGWQVG